MSEELDCYNCKHHEIIYSEGVEHFCGLTNEYIPVDRCIYFEEMK